MECTEIRELLSEYMDDVLDAQTRALVDDHLSVCNGCREELASLQVIVDELGALESVKAPGDFLDRLHDRLESRWAIRRVMRALFVPARIKIPLQVAAGIALAILVFAGLQTHPPEKQMVDRTQPSTQVRLAKEYPLDRVKAKSEEETYRRGPALENASVQPSENLVGTVELALLVVSPEPSTQAQTTSEATDSPPSLQEPSTGIKAETRRAMSSEKRGLTAQAVPEADSSPPSTNEVYEQVKTLIERVKGTVISIQYDEKTGRERSISAQIPAEQYEAFTESLRRVALLKAPPPQLSDKDQKLVPLQIRFVTSE